MELTSKEVWKKKESYDSRSFIQRHLKNKFRGTQPVYCRRHKDIHSFFLTEAVPDPEESVCFIVIEGEPDKRSCVWPQIWSAVRDRAGWRNPEKAFPYEEREEEICSAFISI